MNLLLICKKTIASIQPTAVRVILLVQMHLERLNHMQHTETAKHEYQELSRYPSSCCGVTCTRVPRVQRARKLNCGNGCITTLFWDKADGVTAQKAKCVGVNLEYLEYFIILCMKTCSICVRQEAKTLLSLKNVFNWIPFKAPQGILAVFWNTAHNRNRTRAVAMETNAAGSLVRSFPG